MKKVFSIILLFALVTFNFSKVFLWGYYELNKGQITELYCVNKDKPQLHCCGKCMLRKKLAQDDERKKSPANAGSRNDITLFNHRAHNAVAKPLNSSTVVVSPFLAVSPTGAQRSVFHPPSA